MIGWEIIMSIGLILLVLEILVSADFYMFFLGISAIIVGTINLLISSYTGAELSMWLSGVIFAVLSVLLIFTVRKKTLKALYKNAQLYKSSDIGESVTIGVDDIQVGEMGTGEYRGSSWQVQNKSSEVLKSGEKYTISSLEGIVIVVK